MKRHSLTWNEAEAWLEAHGIDAALAFFPRLTIRNVIDLVRAAEPGTKFRTAVVKFFHWRWNYRISNFQKLAHLHAVADGRAEYVHVALVLKLGGRFKLVEATYPAGVEIKDPRGKAAKFHGLITVVPVAGRVDPDRLEELRKWVFHIEGQRYDSAGAASSPFAWFRIQRLGKFCSHLGARALAILGRLPEWKTVPDHRRGVLVDYENDAGDYLPATLAREYEALPSTSWTHSLLISEHKPEVLRESGDLKRNITADADGERITVGSSNKYSETLEQGGK